MRQQWCIYWKSLSCVVWNIIAKFLNLEKFVNTESNANSKWNKIKLERELPVLKSKATDVNFSISAIHQSQNWHQGAPWSSGWPNYDQKGAGWFYLYHEIGQAQPAMSIHICDQSSLILSNGLSSDLIRNLLPVIRLLYCQGALSYLFQRIEQTSWLSKWSYCLYSYCNDFPNKSKII